MTLSNCSVGLTVQAALQSALDLGAAEYKFNSGKTIALASGTGANQADKVFTDLRTIAASGTDDVDLAGALTDGLGQTITFVKVKVIIVLAADANTNNVVIGNHPTAAFLGPFGAAAHTASVKPGGIAAFACKDAAGWAVTPTTADLLRITNSAGGTSVDYTIIVIGTSA